MEHGIILSDIIPALICRPTKGRTITKANHAHAPEGKRINALSMDEGHGIIFALRAAEPGGKPVGKTWYNML